MMPPNKTIQAKKMTPGEPTVEDPIDPSNKPQVEVEEHVEVEQLEDTT